MAGNATREVGITIRLSDEEHALWNKAWLEQGHPSRSDMIRKCVNSMIMPGDPKTNPRTKKRMVHLSRIAASLIELEAAITAANDNALQAPQLAEDLQAAITHVLSLKHVP